jgi:hypothetical protein
MVDFERSSVPVVGNNVSMPYTKKFWRYAEDRMRGYKKPSVYIHSGVFLHKAVLAHEKK